MADKLMRVGWIGTGVMGKSMAGHLQKSQYGLGSVFNRTASKADSLVNAGAVFKPAVEVAKESDYLFLMLGHPHDVEKMVLDPQQGVLQHMKEGSCLIDHTSSSPDLAVRIAEAASRVGIDSVDAPVTGGDVGAAAGKLNVMCGGEDSAFERVRPLIDIYSQEVTHIGGPGAGHYVKAANQMMIATTMVGVCEALIFTNAAGINEEKVVNLLMNGGAGSFWFKQAGPKILKRDFEPGFYVEHFVKDLGIALEESRKMNISVPGTAVAAQLYQAVMAQENGGRMGIQALIIALEQLNNRKINKF